MNQQILYPLSILLLLFTQFITAQNQLITGMVTDENGTALPGANIVEKGTTNGVTADFDGNFTIEVSTSDAVLQISYVGFLTKEITVGNQSEINVTLKEDAAQLDEVVVVAYGTVKKSDLTGSVSSIKTEEIQATPTVRLDDALRGKVAGLQVTPTSSQPGAAASIRIRGTNSLTGNSSPLFVIDGLIGAGNSADINVNDIESVEVLKDASATALYGSRGSAGVVLITTKRGKAGKAKLSYDTYTTFQSPARLLDVLNAAEFGAWQNEVQGTDAFPNPELLGEGTNWQEEVYRRGAPMVSHTLSASGGSENARYFVSGNYFNQDGIFRGGNLERYQLRLNGDYQLNDIVKIGNSVTISRTTEVPRSSNIINIAGYFPTLPIFDENGEYTIQTVSSELSAENPVGGPAKNINLNTGTRILGTVYAELEPIKNLIYKVNFGTDIALDKSENYAPSTLFEQTNDGGTASIRNREFLSVLLEQTLTYRKEFGNHSLDGLLGYTRQQEFDSGSRVDVRGFTTDFFEYNNIDAGSDRSDSRSDASKFGVESYLFRVNYAYMRKYRLTLNGRIDGSSNFAEGSKWGAFPSVAVAWNAGREAFVEKLNVFNDLKLRASYGRLGNPASGGTSLARLGAGFTYIFGNSGNIVNGIGLNRLGNDELEFETTDQLDLGIDASFFKNRLQVTLDYYRKKTENLFADQEILWLIGVPNASIPTNFGTIENQGFELAVNSINIDKNEFSWETSFNISTNKNEVLSIPDEDGEREINRFGGVINAPSALIKEGEPIGVFYGYKRQGIWNSQDEIDAAGITDGQGVFPGGKRYLDISGPDGVPDGIIDENDRTIIGSPHPDFYGGMSNTLTYKGFEFSMYWAFVLGNDIFNETDSRINTAFDNNVRKKFVDRWTPSNTDTDVPSVRGVFRSEIVSESGVVEDGSFLRLRNLGLGYNIPTENISGIQAAKVYVNGTNLLLFDKYSGYDPEVNRGDSNTRRGYDQAQDPAVRSFTIGLNLTF
ncbi:TonB-dependent receptor [Pricia sp. S334]|uniref:TonB-dependent receptor n=1 Tax=Pricia mediterranea TaxID=3076079 RepID=A0ABU3L4K3_9FLAO|nr:TonB-dependent receptor [Pricia sp. S334]MDT7828362.1 TonB-dependent receptor [Pricia sp. S334]